MNFEHLPSIDSEYAQAWEFSGADDGAAIRGLSVDVTGSCWMKAQDGAVIRIPLELRKLVGKLVREATFR